MFDIEVVAKGRVCIEPTCIIYDDHNQILQFRRFPFSSPPAYFEAVWAPECSAEEEADGKNRRQQKLIKRTVRLVIPGTLDEQRYYQLVKCLSHVSFLKHLLARRNSDERVRILMDLRSDCQISFMWFERILKLINEFIHVYEVMAWLSTLGGAYSAMGEYDDKYAAIAKNISIEQLRLAMKLGDPAQVCRCCIFLAMSAMQRGQLRLSKNILRKQWNIINSADDGLENDTTLRNMIIGTWKRLSHEIQRKGLTSVTTLN